MKITQLQTMYSYTIMNNINFDINTIFQVNSDGRV